MNDDANVYKACDRAIKAMNRESLEAFGQLKMSDWDKVNVIRTVVSVYRKSARKARKRYLKVAHDSYMLIMDMCDIPPKKAQRMAEKAITQEWVDDLLAQTDFVTLYRFDTETERKAYRLAETLEVAQDRNLEIDRALKYWSMQLAQYAINMTDYAMIQAAQDAGVKKARWVTQKDERVCKKCSPLDGRVFRLEDIPVKHANCRCYIIPVID